MGCLEVEKKRIFCGGGYRESRLAYLSTDDHIDLIALEPLYTN